MKFGKNYKKREKKFGADISPSVTERVKEDSVEPFLELEHAVLIK